MRYLRPNYVLAALCSFVFSVSLFAQESRPDTLSRRENWSFHFQETGIGQNHPAFRSPYSGPNSQIAEKQTKYSLTSTIFCGRRLWKGAAVYFNGEVGGGAGLGGALGIGGQPNGETYRIGDPAPVFYVARIFLRQHFAIGPDRDDNPAAANQLGDRIPRKRITLTAGKYSVSDIFDNNAYSHDPRTQFFNWSLMSAGAWDYPANVRGYTYAFTAEYVTPAWAVRAGTSMVPEVANGPYLDLHYDKAHSETVQIDKFYKTGKRSGTIRLLLYNTFAHMGNYQMAINDTQFHHDISLTRAYGRIKTGAALNIEQEITDNSGLFMRLSWNDGLNETWAFTEIDQSASLGYSTGGKKWKRPDDRLGVAAVVNGLSKNHQAYLAAGGSGFILGDGALNYSPEAIAEVYYSICFTRNFFVTPDYQFIMNPGYNKDRGPINVFGVRAHVEF